MASGALGAGDLARIARVSSRWRDEAFGTRGPWVLAAGSRKSLGRALDVLEGVAAAAPHAAPPALVVGAEHEPDALLDALEGVPGEPVVVLVDRPDGLVLLAQQRLLDTSRFHSFRSRAFSAAGGPLEFARKVIVPRLRMAGHLDALGGAAPGSAEAETDARRGCDDDDRGHWWRTGHTGRWSSSLTHGWTTDRTAWVTRHLREARIAAGCPVRELGDCDDHCS